MTHDELVDLFEQAAMTLRALKDREGGFLKVGSGHPEIVRSRSDHFSAEVERRRDNMDLEVAGTRQTATMAGLEALDIVTDLLARLRDPVRSKVLWGAASGWSWRKIGKQVGLHPREAERAHNAAIGACLTLMA